VLRILLLLQVRFRIRQLLEIVIHGETHLRKSLDAFPVELDLKVGVIGDLEQDVDHVLGHEALPLAHAALVVLLHDVLQEPVEHLAELLHPLDVPLQVHPVESRDGVADVEHAVEQEQLVDRAST
jgi:hypothetical protein